ncbi:hypothetical protein RBH29_17445 [Herbivorax sp. ANBcel31]|uniref:DUF7674 family protein n=1 Tax=Herbivorax sp. ANBcel31 TaxID=3069754 RepID=UPI0027B21142|nr:hypothetical protein [Herbivorax sp. ANBcel31]MDQ2088211.1 hypothetical protein [Herbivorax sp. ANBcel31]
MISKKQIIELIIDACPSYKSRWEEYCSNSYNDGEEMLLYVDVSDFVQHIINLYKKNDLKEFDKVFDLIELLHINGDEYVKELATIGILESMQNLCLNSDLNPEIFVQYLKAESKKWWDSLNDFWSGKSKYVGENI